MSTEPRYDVVVVGTGFASSFFLSSYLTKAGPGARFLVLERGYLDSHEWQLQNQRKNRGFDRPMTSSRIDPGETFVNRHPETHDWVHNPSFGGGSNCWTGNVPRFMPSDFELRSRYGVGVDWPITYGELEPYYEAAEEIMAISGPDDGSPYPRRKPYPQPPHRFTDPEMLLKAAHPDAFFHIPTARARLPTANRPRCCATGVCHLCPINAKFTILNEMQHIYEDDRVTLEVNALVQHIEVGARVAKAVNYTQNGILKRVEADLVILGANALFNPHILLRSGLDHSTLGKGLSDQVSVPVSVDLNGVSNYQGSTSLTGFGYMEYDGPHRASRAACLIETSNMIHREESLRVERGKWRQRLNVSFIFEDLPSEQNYVQVSESDPERPEAVYLGHSDYTQRGIDAVPEMVTRLLEHLPVDDFRISPNYSRTNEHILGTTTMGNDREQSIVDRHLVHHDVRNLLVLGSGVFPTSSPSHPTLTLSALSLWAAAHL